MKLFSWFIKTDKRSMTEEDRLETSVSKSVENTKENKLTPLNKNTMWPIAKVKTATMIIKKPA